MSTCSYALVQTKVVLILQLILGSVYGVLGVGAQRCVRCGVISRVAGVSQGGADSVVRVGGGSLVGWLFGLVLLWGCGGLCLLSWGFGGGQ